MQKIKKHLTIIIVAVSSFFVGHYVIRPKQEIKEIVKYVTVEVEKKQTKKTTKVSERRNADGSTSKDTTVVEDSTTDRSVNRSGSKESITSQKRSIIVGISALKDLDKFQDKPDFGANVAVPLIGNLFLTGSADTSKRVGVGFALEF